MSVPHRPQSPGMSAAPAAVDPVDIDLVVRSIARDTLHAGEPFRVACTLGVSASVREGQQRTLSLAVQHVQPDAAPTTPPESAPPVSSATTAAATTARLASAVAVAMGSSPTPRASLTLLDGPLVGSPRATQPAEQEEDDPASGQRIPPPEPLPGDEARYNKLQGATRFLGASTLLVPPMTLVRTHPESSSYSSAPGGGGGSDNDGGSAMTGKEVRFWDFELEYTPLRTGFVPVGGLRVLLLEDRLHAAEEAYLQRRSGAPLVLKEWDVIGEIWVKS
jgi:hypothetical protein